MTSFAASVNTKHVIQANQMTRTWRASVITVSMDTIISSSVTGSGME